jgi:large repetitive protein
VMIVSGTMEFAGASDAHVQFATGMSTTGTLVLDDVVHSPFTGTVTGFAPGDTIDLVGISSGVTVTNSGGLQVNYGTGSFALTGNYNPSEFTVGPDGSGGTDITWNHQAPFILTNNLSTTNNGGTTTVSGLQISDSDPGVTSITLTATTAEAAEGSSISPASTSGSLSAVNAVLASGITYNPGATPPSQDMVTLTAVDNFGATETVNFVFNENSNNNLKGTTGNDVIFSGGGSDVLTGGGGIDQFVFKPTGGPTAVQHTITDFNASLDTLDLRQFPGTSTSAPPTETQVGNDTLVTIDATDSVLLKNVAVASLHASNFILHS